jgi:hypothetical protein
MLHEINRRSHCSHRLLSREGGCCNHLQTFLLRRSLRKRQRSNKKDLPRLSFPTKPPPPKHNTLPRTTFSNPRSPSTLGNPATPSPCYGSAKHARQHSCRPQSPVFLHPGKYLKSTSAFLESHMPCGTFPLQSIFQYMLTGPRRCLHLPLPLPWAGNQTVADRRTTLPSLKRYSVLLVFVWTTVPRIPHEEACKHQNAKTPATTTRRIFTRCSINESLPVYK